MVLKMCVARVSEMVPWVGVLAAKLHPELHLCLGTFMVGEEKQLHKLSLDTCCCTRGHTHIHTHKKNSKKKDVKNTRDSGSLN